MSIGGCMGIRSRNEFAQSPSHESVRRFGVALDELALAFDAEGATQWASETRASRDRVLTGDPRAVNALLDLLHPRALAEATHAARTEALADAIRTMASDTLAERTFRERIALMTRRDWWTRIGFLAVFLIMGLWPLWGMLTGWLESR